MFYSLRDLGIQTARLYGSSDPSVLGTEQMQNLLSGLPTRLPSYPGDAETLRATLMARYWPSPRQVRPIVTRFTDGTYKLEAP